MNDLEFSYESDRPLYEWRITLKFSDGGSRRIYVKTPHWSDFPITEVIDRAIEFHGISEEYIIGFNYQRWSQGVMVR